MSVISFDGVKIRFPNGVEIIVPNFEVHEGEIVSLVGRNGCGKTTALTAALNLIAVSEGTITTNNCAIAAAHPDLPINTSLGVRTYLSSVCRLNGKKIGELESLMESSKLTSLKNRRISRLSTGQHKKVELIAALLSLPKLGGLLIIDEPSNGLDETSTSWLIKVLNNLRNQNVATLITSHDQEFMDAISSRRIVINAQEQIS